MKKPNFFIIGAPKCGTTSLAAWLAEHPQIFFSPVKEPFFFNFDFAIRRFKSLSKYERLFIQAGKVNVALGEGSTSYLYSRTAVPAILKYADQPRFIVMARNPVDMAPSLHEQEVFGGNEAVKDFNKAWHLQKVRVYGDQIPKNCDDPQRLFYGDRCKIGKQLKKLYEIVHKDQVLLLNLDHIKNNPREEYLKVLGFLDLKDDNRQDFPVINTAKERRFPALWHFIRKTNNALRTLGVPHIRLGITSFIYYRTRRERPRPPMIQDMRRNLLEYFMDDIILLEELSGWDLTEWKSVK